MNIRKGETHLYASVNAVITQFLFLPGNERVKRIIERIKQMDEQSVKRYLDEVKKNFTDRHRNLESIFFDHFNRVEKQQGDDQANFSEGRKLLLGAFFTKEYSI